MSLFIKYLSKIGIISTVPCRSISTTNYYLIDAKWRQERGLPGNPNAFGPLTNLPDYTFMDGRPTPLGSRQTRRLMKQRQTTSKMVNLIKELNFAKENHKKRLQEKENEMRNILESKLKPKGHLLLQK